ncbi:MAG TPA: cupin domain-containing protein [Gaiellaceae bacterium]|nr:cupin domain-containing protein [Gaiellaceae bacterium]
MIGFDTQEHELVEQGDLSVAFPLHEARGTASTAVVLFELAPGSALPSHTDSAEETLLVLRGEGEATIGDETARLTAGQAAVVPASAPHGIRNVGEEPLRVLGFFSSATILSVFAEPPAPGAPTLFVNGTPVEALAEVFAPA